MGQLAKDAKAVNHGAKAPAARAAAEREGRQRKARIAMLERADAAFTVTPAEGGDTRVAVAHGLTGFDVRVVAIDAAGAARVADAVTTQVAGRIAQTVATFRGVAPAKLGLLRLEARPYQWVQFRGVALRKGTGGGGPAPTAAPFDPAADAAAARREVEREIAEVEAERAETRKRLRAADRTLAEAERALAAAPQDKLTVEQWA